MSPMSGARSCAGLQAPLSPERPAPGGRAHPAPGARHSLPLTENNRSWVPSRLPSRREPNFLYLGRGGGLYAKGARPGTPSRVGAGRGRSAEAGSSPSPLARDSGPESRGKWAAQSPAAAAGRHSPLDPPAAPSRAPSLRHSKDRLDSEGQVPICRIHGPLGLAVLGIPSCFPVPPGGLLGRHRCLSLPFAGGRQVWSRRKMIL